ncbi:MAG: hypothetical protein I4O49_04335 [Janthinobacterium lividum]|nr:hypothetical protein [Janthinobacterium lividum]
MSVKRLFDARLNKGARRHTSWAWHEARAGKRQGWRSGGGRIGLVFALVSAFVAAWLCDRICKMALGQASVELIKKHDFPVKKSACFLLCYTVTIRPVLRAPLHARRSKQFYNFTLGYHALD